jgi:hypothetical protein
MKRSIRINPRQALILALILAVGSALRFYGLHWDEGHWLHPDERQIYFIVLNLDWPRSLAEALSPSSPLNPGFFAYGSLPIYLLKAVASLVKLIWPALWLQQDLHLVARPLSALFDLGTIYLTYRLARQLLPHPASQDDAEENTHQVLTPARSRGLSRAEPREQLEGGALLAAAFVSLAVIHVQLARFYTVDPFLTFFVLLTLHLAAIVARGGGRRHRVALGAALGLALATKVSATPLVFVLFVACYTRSPRSQTRSPISHSLAAVRCMLLPLVVAGAVFFLVQPYALIDWRTFLDQTIRESQIARGALDVPYTIQYAGTLPFLYPIWQTALWGMALPLGLVAWSGLAAGLIRWLRHGSWTDALLLAWAGPYFVITGLLYTKYLRYMLPIVPVLCILGAGLLVGRFRGQRIEPSKPRSLGIGALALGMRLPRIVALVVVLSTLTCALLFASLYAAPHSWVTVSEWIYRNVPAGSILAVEHWDTALPLPVEVDGRRQSPTEYTYRTLPLYDEPDDSVKWESLAADLAGSDYLIVASRRLYGSIPRLPDRYPVTTRYYDRLLAGGPSGSELGFELVGEFTRGPAWLNPRLPPLPDPAPALFRPDESLVVYDHPRALIFRNAGRLSADELLQRLEAR